MVKTLSPKIVRETPYEVEQLNDRDLPYCMETDLYKKLSATHARKVTIPVLSPNHIVTEKSGVS